MKSSSSLTTMQPHYHPTDIARIRDMLVAGLSDEAIALQFEEERVDGLAAAEFEDAAYGSDTEITLDGPAHLHDDDYYQRNDAGEYCWM